MIKRNGGKNKGKKNVKGKGVVITEGKRNLRKRRTKEQAEIEVSKIWSDREVSYERER